MNAKENMSDIAPGRPTVLYQATLALWMRVLSIVVGACLLIFLGTAARLTVIDGRGGSWIPFAIVAPVLLFSIVIIVLANRMSFTVSTAGITIRGYLRTVDLGWADIAAIEVDRGFWHLGRTVVVTRDGRRVGSMITEARSALRRGESTFDHGTDLTQPALPTRAAIEGHQRFLRGDFGR